MEKNKNVNLLLEGSQYVLVEWNGEFVVGRNYDKKTSTWISGSYFPELESAVRIFLKKDSNLSSTANVNDYQFLSELYNAQMTMFEKDIGESWRLDEKEIVSDIVFHLEEHGDEDIDIEEYIYSLIDNMKLRTKKDDRNKSYLYYLVDYIAL